MKITRARLTNYRGIESLEVRLPRRGLCVLLGDNEAGKTSLVEAIDLLLHFPHDSRNHAVLAVKPVHRDAGAEVEIDAEAGAFSFTYRKRYHVAPRSELVVHAPRPENKTGREAHERVRAILRDTVDLDLWRALRVGQGSIGEQPDLVATPSLTQALAESARQATQQHADLLDAVRREYERYFTPTGERRRTWLDEEAELLRQQQLVADLERATSEIERDAERAVALERQLIECQGQRAAAAATCAALAREREAAQAHAQELARAEQEAGAAELGLRHCERAVRLLAERDRLDAQHAQAHAAALGSAASKSACDDALAAALAACDNARARRDAAQRAVLCASKSDKLAAASRALRDLRALMAAAAAARTFTAAEVDDLARLAAALVAAQARLAAQAAHVRVRARGACAAQVTEASHAPADLPLRAGDERAFVVPTRLDLDLGPVQVEVRAGPDAEDLAATAAHAKAALHAALRELGVASVEQARQHLSEQRERQRAITELERMLTGLLGEREVNRLDAARDALAAEVEALRTPANADAGDLAAVTAAADAAERVSQAAQRAQLDAQGKAQRTALAAANVSGLLQANGTARAALAEAGTHFDTASDAEAALPAAAARLDAARRALAALQRQGVRALAAVDADLARARAAERAAGAIAEQTRDQLTALRSALAVRGDEGLAERLGRAQSQLGSTVQDLDGKRRRAAAASTLLAALGAARDTCVQSYHRPIREQLERLGRMVFGSSFHVTLDDRLQVSHRTLDGVTVPFAALSLGAREQIAILLRLACALAVAPHSGVPVWLDDALGQSDPERLRGMGQVLRLVGERCQVVLLTCSPQRAQWPGATVVRVSSRGGAREAAG